MLCSNWRRQRPDWNPIRETISIASGATITRKYLWGHDLAGWRSGQYDQEAGGIGGLLAISVATNTQAAVAYFPLTDGQGNIRHAVDGAGNVVATYDYDPFGTLIAESGPAKGVCPFRFSSKYYDSETGLLYFGYRFFDSRTAKWLSVDPLGEQGGLNLTAYCMNDPVNQNDPVGLAAVDLAAAWIWDRILGRGNRLSQVYRDKDAFENRIAEDAIKEMARKVTDVNTYQGNAPFTEIVDTARGLSASLASRGFGGTVKQVLPRVYHLATTDNLLSRESQTAATELTYELAILFSLPRAVGPRGAPLAANKVVPPPLPIQPPPLPGNLVPSGRLAGAGAVAENATDFIGTKVRWGKQRLHLEGAKELDAVRGYMRSTDDAQAVLDAFHGGRAQVLSVDKANNAVTVYVKGIRGVFRAKSGTVVEESSVFILKGLKQGASVVPANPRLLGGGG
jgi:RHS repeat-associated protein